MTAIATSRRVSFDTPREAKEMEPVHCPEQTCGRRGPDVSGDWVRIRWKCQRCREMREVCRS